MKTYLSELLSNGNASKFFWTLLTAGVVGGIGWLSNLSFQVWEVKASQQVAVVEKKHLKDDVKEVKKNVKDVQRDVKEIREMVYQISKKV